MYLAKTLGFSYARKTVSHMAIINTFGKKKVQVKLAHTPALLSPRHCTVEN